MSKNLLLFVIIASVLLSSCQSETAIDRIKADVNFLCSPELKGRDVPGETGDQTAFWIEQQFKEIGLKPVKGRTGFGYRFEVPIVEARLDTLNTVIVINGVKFGWGNGFYTFPKRISPVDLNLIAVWCEGGDYSKAQDKAAIIQATGRPAAFAAAAAKRAGVRALVVICSDSLKEVSRKLKDLKDNKFRLVDLPNSDLDFPVIYLYTGDESLDLTDNIDLHLSVQFTDYVDRHGYNVLGRIDGTEPGFVIIGAHYDHLGEVPGSVEYYPGADDNASGVAGLLELSRMWVERPPDGRSLIAAAFTAEEDGMLGSKYSTMSRASNSDRINAMINMDMIGRNGFCGYRDVHNPDAVVDTNYVGVFYSAQSPELEELINRSNSDVSLSVDLKGINSFPFSDAGSFHDIEVPTVHLFSGYHSDYSSVNDTPDKLNYYKLSRIVNLVDQILKQLKQNEVEFDPDIRAKSSGMHY